MIELDIDVSGFGTFEEIVENIRYSLSLGLPEFQPALVKNDGTAILVGSGPSVKHLVEELRVEKGKGRAIISINGGHDFLMKNGIVPDLFVTTDPRGMPQNFKYKNDETIYLLASRVDPGDFKSLEGCRIVLWHAESLPHENAEIEDKVRVAGGTTSGLRAVNIAYMMGFRKLKFYGIDSCLVNKAKRWDSAPMTDEVKTIDVRVGDRTFLCNMAMAQQAQEFQSIFDIMPDLQIESTGDGLITAILDQREREGITNENLHRRRPETASSSVGTSPLNNETGIEASFNHYDSIRPTTDNESRLN